MAKIHVDTSSITVSAMDDRSEYNRQYQSLRLEQYPEITSLERRITYSKKYNHNRMISSDPKIKCEKKKGKGESLDKVLYQQKYWYKKKNGSLEGFDEWREQVVNRHIGAWLIVFNKY
tara:strand:+ start:138 stop:491 length:354 start_codon:yes stop_codon:yes gene_type:complete